MRILLGTVINVKRIDYSFCTIRHSSVLLPIHSASFNPQYAPSENINTAHQTVLTDILSILNHGE
jgi:hypothetical protein